MNATIYHMWTHPDQPSAEVLQETTDSLKRAHAHAFELCYLVGWKIAHVWGYNVSND
jgi:hypothetical protein